MRTLPDAPNVDHLRHQAKELRAVLAETDPNVTLAEAQRRLAEQYGFGAWAELKAAAEERAAAGRDEAPPELAAALASAFGLPPASTLRRTAVVWAGEAWRLATGDGPIVLTRLAPYVHPEHLELQATLVDAAIAAGIVTPRPVRTVDGTITVDVDGTRWQAHRPVPMGPEPSKPAPTALMEATGRTLATIHGLAVPPPAPVATWLTDRHPRGLCLPVVERARAQSLPWAGDALAALPTILELDAVADDRDPNERAVFAHCDIQPCTIAPSGHGVAVHSWHHAGATPPEWDLGYSLLMFRTDDDERPPRALLQGYRSVAGPIELSRRSFTASVNACLNWLLTRLNLASDPDSPADTRAAASREIPALLRDLPTLDRIDRLLATLA